MPSASICTSRSESSRSTTVPAGSSADANSPRPAMSLACTSTSSSATGDELCERLQQAVDVAIVGVRREPHPEAALVTQPEPVRRLVGVERARGGVDVPARQVAAYLLRVVAGERREQGRRTPRRSAVERHPRQAAEGTLETVAQPVLVLLQRIQR